MYNNAFVAALNMTGSDQIASYINARLAVPGNVGPAVAEMVGEAQLLELRAAIILEMDRLDHTGNCHVASRCKNRWLLTICAYRRIRMGSVTQ